MSDQLIDWLNCYVKLSSPITSIEADFANGFFFGELLSKFQQIPNYADYENKTDKATVMKNFIHLTKALSDLNIHLSEARQHELIHKVPGVAAQILYRIKQQLAKKQIDYETLKAKTSQEISRIYKAIEFPNENEKYFNDFMNNKDLKGNRGKIRLDPIQKIAATADALTKGVLKSIRIEEDYLKKEHMKGKGRIFSMETARAKTMRERDQKQLKLWKKDIAKKEELEAKVRNEKWEEVMMLIKETLKSFKDSSEIEISSIKGFDETLARLGLDIPKIESTLSSEGNGSKAKFISTEIIMNRIREKVALEEKSRKDKKKRARKLDNEQMKILAKTTRDRIESQKQNELLEMMKAQNEEERQNAISRQKNYEDYEKMKQLHLKDQRSSTNVIDKELQTDEQGSKEPYVSIEDYFNEKVFFDQLDKETVSTRLAATNAKRAKRERYSKSIQSAVDMLVDITEKAYDYQKGSKVDLIHIPDWGNWMSMFKEDNEVLHSLHTLGDQHSDTQKEVTQSIHPGFSQEMINYSNEELFDYVNFIGQWKDKPVSSQQRKAVNKKPLQLPFYDIMGNDISYLLAAGKYPIQGIQVAVLKATKNEAFEPKREDEENAEVPTANCFNPSVGEILSMSLEIKHSSQSTVKEETPSSLTIESFDHIPIKLCFVGHLLSGRKTQAGKLVEMLAKMKVYSVDSLLKQLIETFERLATPIENHPRYKTLKKNQIEQMQKDKQLEEEKFMKFKMILSPFIKEGDDTLIDKEKVTDLAIISFIFEKIKEDFPFKTKEEVNSEISLRNKRKEEIVVELEKMKEDQAKKAKGKPKEEQSLTNEYNQLINDSYSGFILIDFPKTYEQFVLFEKRTKGNVQEIDREPTEKFKTEVELTRAVDRPYHSLATKSKMKSFFDGYCLFNVSEKDLKARFNGRKVDPNTGIMYSLEDNPPPENDKKLNERLEAVKDPSEEAVMTDKKAFSSSFKKIISYVELYNNVNRIAQEQKKITDITLDIKQTILAPIVSLYEKTEEESINDQQQVTIPAIVNNNSVNSNNTSLFTPDQLKTQFTKRLTDCKRKLPVETASVYLTEWSSFNQAYTDILQHAFIDITEQKRSIIAEMTSIQDSFILFLNTPSNKKELISIFCQKYSSFMEAYHHLQKSFIVKSEFQLDLNRLTDRLWEMINQRKATAIAERERIMASGFIEEQMNAFYANIEQLFLSETEKYLRSFCLIRNFYFSIDHNRPSATFGEKPPFGMTIKPSRILKDIAAYELLASNGKAKGFTSPRIERIYLNCFKLIFEFDYAIRELEKSMRATLAMNVSELSAISHKRRVKMNIGIAKQQVETSQLNEEPFQIEEEVKSAIRKEKEKYKYRIGIIKGFSQSFLENIQRIADETYTVIDEWIIDSVHYQNTTMNSLIAQLRSIVDRSAPVKWNVELDVFNAYKPITPSFDIQQDEKSFKHEQTKLNLTALEKEKERQLRLYDTTAFISLYHLMRSYEIQPGFILQEDFIAIFLKKSMIEESSKGVSKQFKELSYHNYAKLIRKYSFGMNSFICVKSIFCVIALLQFNVITQDEIDSMNKGIEANESSISKSDYEKLPLWFEEEDYEQQHQEGGNEGGESRSFAIRDVLYEIFKEANDHFDYQLFRDVIALKHINSAYAGSTEQFMSYLNLLFID